MPSNELERRVVETAEHQRDRYYGKFRGIVRDVDDPEGMGRITAEVPEVYGDVESPWALPCVPFAGAAHGLVVLPEQGDGVWIEFEGGDVSRPVWTGCWWARGEMPAQAGTKTRALITSGGHQLILDDDANTVQLLHAAGAEITMDQSSITLTVSGTTVKLSASGFNVNNGAFEVR